MKFRGGKLLIYQANGAQEKLNTLRFMSTINLGTWYCFMNSIYRVRIIRSLFWGMVSVFLSRRISNMNKMWQQSIYMMHLTEDGMQVEITFIDGSSLLVDITSITRLSEGIHTFNHESEISHVNSKQRIKAFHEF